MRTTISPNNECNKVDVFITSANVRPTASGMDPTKNKNPVAPINSVLETLFARRYMAIGGDQIELKPPRTPEKIPTPVCHFNPLPRTILVPNIWVNEKVVMAKPMDTMRTAFGKDMIKNDVRKMLIIIEMPNSQYFFAILTLFSHLIY